MCTHVYMIPRCTFSVLTSGQWRWNSTTRVNMTDILKRQPVDLGTNGQLTNETIETILNAAAGAAHMWVPSQNMCLKIPRVCTR